MASEIDARLLGHDDRDGVVLLGEPERGAMSGAQLAAHARVDRQRQEAGRRRDAVALDDHGAVVQRRAGLEDAGQQVVGHGRIERNATLDVVAQANLPLDDDDRADAARGQRGGRHHQLLDRLIVARRALEVPEERRAAEVRQRAPDVRLEQHDDRKDHVGGQVANHPVDRLELEPPREEKQTDEEAAAQRHLHRARAADEQQQLVDQDRDQRDVEQIRPGDGGTLRRNSVTATPSFRHRDDTSESRRPRARPRTSSPHGMDAHDVRAAQHGGGHRGRRRPVPRGDGSTSRRQRPRQEPLA